MPGKGVEFIEIPVAYDGLTIVAAGNEFIDTLTVEQLKMIFRADKADESFANANKWL